MKIVIAKEPKHFFDLMKIRTLVFVKEQMIDPKIEIDVCDYTATHLVAYLGNIAVATARINFHDDEARIGRVAVLEAFRKQGIASKLICELENLARNKGEKSIKIYAQMYAKKFYLKLGYEVFDEPFYEAGIYHCKLRKII